MPEIIPSMLVESEDAFKKQINAVKELVDMVQIDLADGKFVENTTWTYLNPDLAQQYLGDIDFELHLMVAHPAETLKHWLGNQKLKRVLVHIESNDAEKALSEAKSQGKQVGVVLNPDTEIEKVKPYLDKIDYVMLMGVHPGFQGQKFIDKTLERIKQVKQLDANMPISIDGAVNKKTIKSIVNAGADILCPGSAVFGDLPNIKDNIASLKELT